MKFTVLILFFALQTPATPFDNAVRSINNWMESGEYDQVLVMLEALTENDADNPILPTLMHEIAFHFVWIGERQIGSSLYQWAGHLYRERHELEQAISVYEIALGMLRELNAVPETIQTLEEQIAQTRDNLRPDGINLEIQQLFQGFYTLLGHSSQVVD